MENNPIDPEEDRYIKYNINKITVPIYKQLNLF